jgi:DNA-binding response OmpR family regulator
MNTYDTFQANGTLILVAEDDPKTAKLIEGYLINESYTTVLASDGEVALELFAKATPRLVVLDVMLPKVSGWAVCTSIRKTSDTPILFLTARDDEMDRLLGLELGGDDYVVKPFSPRELVARIKAILRRTASNTHRHATKAPHSVAGLSLDDKKRRFTLHGDVLSLTPLEFSLLRTLMTSPGRVFLRTELLDQLYPNGESVIDRVIDVHVGKLRQKIGDDPADPRFIHTVRGIGYRFVDFGET